MWDWWRAIATGGELTYSELKAWAEMTDTPILPWEAKLVISLDRTFWRVIRE